MEKGSPLADNEKKYNTLAQIVRASELHGVQNYFNDPTIPEDTLVAQNEQLKIMVQQLQDQIKNPLAEAEMVKQKGSAARDHMNNQHETRLKAMDINQKNSELQANTMLDVAKLELDNNIDLPGGLV